MKVVKINHIILMFFLSLLSLFLILTLLNLLSRLLDLLDIMCFGIFLLNNTRFVWYVILNNSFQYLNTENCSSKKNVFGKSFF